MPRDLYDIGKEAARHAVKLAEQGGYRIAGKHSVMFRSDLLDLAGTISLWLEGEMEPSPEAEP